MADDIKALAAAVGAAEDTVAKMVKVRHGKRTSMPKAEFKAYNADTAGDQLAATQAVTDAHKALAGALNNSRQQLLVGTVMEHGGGGGIG